MADPDRESDTEAPGDITPGRARALLAALVLLALALRLWAISDVPPGLDTDEASIGYNAYTLARTGRDEYGTLLPLVFRGFSEFKRPAYVYATVPSVVALGPTPAAVRVPAAIFGTLSVVVLYALGTALLRRRWVGLRAAALLAVSPWHLQFTRTGREVSLLVLMLMLCAWFVVTAAAATPPTHTGARPHNRYMLAALALLVALYTYPSGLVLVPLLGALLARVYWRGISAAPRRWLLAAFAVFALGSVPQVLQVLDGRALARLDQASLLNQPAVLALSQSRVERDRRDGAPWVLQTAPAVALRQAIDNYAAHFNPTFLFTRGDAEWRHHSTDSGQLYLWDAPLLLAGIVTLWRRWRLPAMQLIGGWLLLAPLPGTFAENAPHAIRSIAMLPPLYLLAAAGVPRLWSWLRPRRLHLDWIALLAISVTFYLYGYYRYYPYEHGRSWGAGLLEGYREIDAYIGQPIPGSPVGAGSAGSADGTSGAGSPDRLRFARIVIPQEMGLTYIYALYATGYDPARYLAQGGTRATPDSPFWPQPGPLVFDPYHVRRVDWASEPRDPTVLYVLEGGSRPPAGLEVVYVARDPSGRETLQVAHFPARSAPATPGGPAAGR